MNAASYFLPVNVGKIDCRPKCIINMDWDSLTPELLQRIFGYIDLDDFEDWSTIKRVSKYWLANATTVHRFDNYDAGPDRVYFGCENDYRAAVALGLDIKQLYYEVRYCPMDVIEKIAASGPEGVKAVLREYDTNWLCYEYPNLALIVLRQGPTTDFVRTMRKYVTGMDGGSNNVGSNDNSDEYEEGEYEEGEYEEGEYEEGEYEEGEYEEGEYEEEVNSENSNASRDPYYDLASLIISDVDISTFAEQFPKLIWAKHNKLEALYAAVEMGSRERERWLIKEYDYMAINLAIADEIFRQSWKAKYVD